MGLVRHANGYRRIWMFPRNIRAIHPWKMSQILSLLMHAIKSGEWNQSLQDLFCTALEAAGLKKRGVQYDPHSGGPRTYFSQMKCLGLLFSRDDGNIYPTIAGKDLADGLPPLPILQHLLMNHQYPSAYSNFPNVKINPLLKIKPFLFVLDLIRCPEIGSLSNSELCVPVVYGHNYECLDLCREKILRMRESGLDFVNVVGSPDFDLYLPRSSGDLNLTLANIGDIANTCKNYMKACCLIYENNSSGEQRIHFSDDITELYERTIQGREKYYPFVGEEPFQRAYGAWNKRKDTRSLVDFNVLDTVGAKEGVVLSQFYKLCGNQLIDELPDEFIETMTTGYGFSRDEVIDIVSPHMRNSMDFFEATFLDSSRGGISTALTFEKALTDLMHKKFGFFAKHTGQLNRTCGVGGYSDVFIVADSFNKCAILDAKASPSYALSSDDYSKLISNYIPNYLELLEKFDETRGQNIELEFCSYVAGGFRGDISYKLEQAYSATDVRCSAIKARDLLRLAKDGVSQSVMRGRLSGVRLLSGDDV